MAGQQFGLLIQAVTNMGTAIVIAFIYGPKLAGVIFLFIPLMFAAGLVQGKMVQDNTKGSLQDLDESSQVRGQTMRSSGVKGHWRFGYTNYGVKGHWRSGHTN